MICQRCRLEAYGGFHSPGWCFDYLEPERPAVVLPPKPQPVLGQLAVCAIKGCYGPTVPGRVSCAPCLRELAGKRAAS